MGCISSKASHVEDIQSSRRNLSSSKYPSELKLPRVNSTNFDGKIWEKDRLDCGDVTVMLFDKKTSGSVWSYGDQLERKKTEIPEISIINHPCLERIPKVAEAEQVAVGWPPWLALVAAEAIKGWIPRRANTFVKLNKIGQGTYSSVYRARDVTLDKIVALKKVRFDNHDTESIKFMAREILVLRRLDHPNVIKLEGLITSQTSCSLYLVFEYMEHDLTGLASSPGVKFTEPQVKCYMKQLLSGLDHCHSHGVLHRDIKGSNLLIDNNGMLKIADFGLSILFNPCLIVPMTSRVVTLWYRAPELLLGASHYGVGVDLWSTGCILGELYAGKPILPGKTEVEQLHKIFRLCGSPSEDYWDKLHLRHSTVIKPPQPYKRYLKETFIDFPAPAVGLIDSLLSIDPAERGTAAFALKSKFFTASPLACDPSSLPNYPPSKEIDAKLWEEEARRQRAIAANANSESITSMQNTQGHCNSKPRSDILNLRQDEAVHGFLVVPNKDIQPNYNATYSGGSLIHRTRRVKSSKAFDDSTSVSSDHSTLTSRTTDLSEKTNQSSKFPKQPSLHGRGPKGNQIYVSGSFLVSSSNVDRMLKVHDRRVQEYARRARVERSDMARLRVKGANQRV